MHTSTYATTPQRRTSAQASALRRIISCGLLLFALSACDSTTTDVAYLDRARQALTDNKLQTASIELKNALKVNANNVDARLLLATVSLALGDALTAEKELRVAERLRADPKQLVPPLAEALLSLRDFEGLAALDTQLLEGTALAEVLAHQATAQLMQGHIAAADQLLWTALDIAPESPVVQTANARLSGDRGQVEQATELVAAALADDPDYYPALELRGDLYLRAGNPEAAIATYTDLITARPQQQTTRLKRAFVRLQTNDRDGAASDIAKLLPELQEHPGVGFINGVLLFLDDQIEAAIPSLEVAARAPRTYQDSLYFLSLAHARVGNTAQAEGAARRFFREFPNSEKGRKLLATIALRNGDYAEAEALIRPVVEAANDDSGEDTDAMVLLAGAIAGTDDEGSAESLRLLGRVAELEPESAQAKLRYGAALMAVGRVDEGTALLQDSLQLDPKYQTADVILILNHLARGDTASALTASQAFVARNPDSSVAYNVLGRVYLSANDTKAAKDTFETADRLQPGDPITAQGLAAAALADGDREAARGYFEATLLANGDNLTTLLDLARLAAADDDEQQMVDYLQRARTAFPDAVQPALMLARIHLYKGEPEEALFQLGNLPEGAAELLAVGEVIALSQMSAGNYAAARDSLRNMLEQSPDNPAILYELARANTGLGDTRRARLHLLAAVEASPKLLLPRLTLTRALLREGDHSAFAEQVSILAQLAPENADILSLQGTAARLAGDNASAMARFREAYVSSPDRQSLLNLANQHHYQGETSEAVALMDSWLSTRPADIPIILAQADLFRTLGRLDEAVAGYKAALSLDPDQPVVLNNLAWALRETSPAQALDYAEQALKLVPESPAVMDTLGALLLANGDLQRAERMIDRALSLAPDDLQIQLHRAQVHSAMGQKRQALALLEPLVQPDMEFPAKADAASLYLQLRQ